MRRTTFRKAAMWLAPGCMLWLSCPAGTGKFLAPIVQPIIGQVLSDVATSFTQDLLGQIEQQ